MTKRRVGQTPPQAPGDPPHPFQRLRAELEEFRDMLADASYDRGGLPEGAVDEDWFSSGGGTPTDSDGLPS